MVPEYVYVPRIMCAACRKPVDEVIWWDEPDTRLRIIAVKCHGEVDRMSLRLETLEDYGDQLKHAEGLAFVSVKELTNG